MEDWQKAWKDFDTKPTEKSANNLIPTSDSVKSHDDNLQILRVNQLDSERLDVEIGLCLNAYFKRIFMFFDPTIISRIQPELMAVLHGLIYKFSVYESDQSFGDRLQNLKYTNHRISNIFRSAKPANVQKILHAFLIIGLPWAHARLNKILTEHEGEDAEKVWWLGNYTRVDFWRKLNKLEMYIKLMQMVNFLVFLVDGKYRNIADRIMGMRLVYARKLMLRQVSFDYMNRELVWGGFVNKKLAFENAIPFFSS
ncbi:peroxin [Acrasis kona]|uniref:RING-type E3 ubiquitin transferase (cysteine targeting) n=1 Tax=Acrasis kona TaxID=1008807 RepID=A0AAW2ZQ61_9EUKA